MKVFRPIFMKANIEGEPAAIQFDQDYLQIDPRQADQIVTTCYLRPLEGPKRLFVGVAVFNPNDGYEIPLYGKKMALARALQSFLGYGSWSGCWQIARQLIWQYLQLEEMQTKQAAAAQEMERLEELREQSAAMAGLPAGPVSQFIHSAVEGQE